MYIYIYILIEGPVQIHIQMCFYLVYIEFSSNKHIRSSSIIQKHMYISIYIYIDIEREREECIFTHIYIYKYNLSFYIYVYICVYRNII